MQDRIIQFIRGLRAAGVRISLSESLDAMQAAESLGIMQKPLFRSLLRSTLIKDSRDFDVFDELFPLYFRAGQPPLHSIEDELTADERSMLEAALQQFDERIQQLLEWLTSGEGPTAEELEQLAEQSGVRWAGNSQAVVWITRRMMQQMGFGQLPERLQELYARLSEMGMEDETVQRLMGIIEINRETLTEYMAQQVGYQIANQRAERPEEIQASDLAHKPFGALSQKDVDQLRQELQRMLRQLRTRAALRRKRDNRGKFDARNTIRQSQRYGGVPFEIKHKKRKLKPSLVFIFDVSNSMQQVVAFMLHFVFELQDQVSKTRSFAFYDNLAEVSSIVNEFDVRDANDAFRAIQQAIPGYLYHTNLGRSLDTFYDNHLSAVNGRTTVIIMGDGRNNYYDPRLDLVEDLKRRAKRLIWFTPEHQRQWGTGDSHMHLYAPICDAVFPVRNLAQLSTPWIICSRPCRVTVYWYIGRYLDPNVPIHQYPNKPIN